MGTIALFITVFILLCIFALIFVCYRAGRDSRQQQDLQDEETGAMRRATIVLSIVPGSTAAAAFAAQQPYSSHRPRPSNRKTPTPPTIIRNLPVVIWDKPKAAAHAALGSSDTKQQVDVSHASADSDPETKECLCVICCCEYEVGEPIKLLPCLHMYHQGCIDAWLERSHVCPVCQADVIRAAGLSAAVGDWSVHTQEAVNVISGVHPHSQPATPVQQQQQQDAPSIQPQQQQQQQEVAAPLRVETDRQLNPLPVSSPLLSPAAAAAAAGDMRVLSSSSFANSTDAVALVLTRGSDQGAFSSAHSSAPAAAATVPAGQAAAGMSGGTRG